jgi:hypothetical protein
MALFMPFSTLSAQNPPAGGGAVITPRGMVTIDGELTTKTSTLLGNETISTGPDSAAHVTLPGTNTVLASNTIASFSQNSIQLKSGGMKITSSSGIVAQVGKLKFVPANPKALTTFEVQKSGCEISVIANSGSISLPDGKILEQGRSFSRSEEGCEPANQTSAQSHHIPPAYWILGGVAAAGTGAGIALLNSGGSTPVSPSRP